MIINRECDYALRLVRNLNEITVTNISTIVERENVTKAIAYKVARKLEKAGLIRSVRGNAGGYMLTRKLDEITILDVYRIMEPDGLINSCFREGETCPHKQDNSCILHCELARIQSVLFDEMNRKTIRQLIEEHQTV